MIFTDLIRLCRQSEIAKLAEKCSPEPLKNVDLKDLVENMALGDLIIFFKPGFLEHACLVKRYTENNWWADKHMVPPYGGIIFEFLGRKRTWFGDIKTFYSPYRAETIIYHRDDKDVPIKFIHDLISDLKSFFGAFKSGWLYCKHHMDLGLDEKTVSDIIKMNDAIVLISTTQDIKKIIREMDDRIEEFTNPNVIRNVLAGLDWGDVVFIFTKDDNDIDKICTVVAIPTIEESEVKVIMTANLRRRTAVGLLGEKYILEFVGIDWDYKGAGSERIEMVIDKIRECRMVPGYYLRFNLLEIYRPFWP